MKAIHTPGMPKVKGHYSPVMEHNGILYLSGQIPSDPQTGNIPEGIDAQTELVFSKIRLLLEESGSGLSKVIQVRIYLSDISFWDRVNALYSEIFGDHKPARCVVPVGKLHYGALIEVEAIACF